MSVVAKQYMSLFKSIQSFSDGQASISDNQKDDDSLTHINVTISPNDGLYKKGKFEFELDISDGYPDVNPPKIRCLTKVYHPNIDQIDEYSEGDICLNLIDELWTPELTLEDYVQGLLFMFYNPNVEDPLNPAFCGDEDEDRLRYNVRRSMRGKEVEGIEYDQVLPDGYESDDGESYEDEFEGKKTKDDTSISDGESDAESVEASNTENTLMLQTLKAEETQLLPTIEETAEPAPLSIKPVSDLVAVISRILRFLRPSASSSPYNGGSALAVRSRLGSVIVCSVAIIALRVGLRMFMRTPLITIVR